MYYHYYYYYYYYYHLLVLYLFVFFLFVCLFVSFRQEGTYTELLENSGAFADFLQTYGSEETSGGCLKVVTSCKGQ